AFIRAALRDGAVRPAVHFPDRGGQGTITGSAQGVREWSWRVPFIPPAPNTHVPVHVCGGRGRATALCEVTWRGRRTRSPGQHADSYPAHAHGATLRC